MWFSPNHRANRALWFWFPCITGLKLRNHLIPTHTYTHRHTVCAHTTKQIQILGSDTKSRTCSVRQRIPNTSPAMDFTAEISAQRSFASISCGDKHNFVVSRAVNKWRCLLMYRAAAHAAADTGFERSRGKVTSKRLGHYLRWGVNSQCSTTSGIPELRWVQTWKTDVTWSIGGKCVLKTFPGEQSGWEGLPNLDWGTLMSYLVARSSDEWQTAFQLWLMQTNSVDIFTNQSFLAGPSCSNWLKTKRFSTKLHVLLSQQER